MIQIVPVVASLALSRQTTAYIATGIAGFIHSAWTTEIPDSGLYTKTYEDEYIEVDLSAMNFDTALADYEATQKQTMQQKIDEYINNYVPPAQTISTSKQVQDIPSQVGLIDVMKASATESIEQQKILNNNLTALNGTLASLLQAKNSELINQNQSNAILSENLLALNKSMATLATLPKVTAEVNTSPKVTNTVKMTPTFNVSMQPNMDTTALATATQTLATGVENQIATNAKIVEKLDKQMEHYDFVKDGVSTLKDSNGNQIKPREVQAKKDAEQFIDQEDINKTTIDDLLEYLPESLGGALDKVADVLGSTDGFSETLNPFSFVDNLLKTEYQTNKDKYSSTTTTTP